VFGAASEAIELPDQNGIESAALGVGHQPIQLWAGILRARDAIDVITHDVPAAALDIFP
jgi:hypothetical protein